MKVSIVTVSYNSAATIAETMNSVLGQEGVEVEYIVVDGASTDGTPDLIHLRGDRLAWWISEKDRGQVDALNKGFARATGDIMGFLNADDVLIPGALSAVCRQFAAEPEADIVYGGIEWIDFEGRPIGSHHGDISSLEEVLDIFHVWWGEKQWVQPEVFFRRSLKERVGEFDERYNLAFDYDFWVRCFLAGATASYLQQPLVRFRRHAGQKSVETERAVEEIRSILGENLSRRLPISLQRQLTLFAQLGYDRYQASPEATRPSFFPSLLRHPEWLLSPPARQRILAAASRILGRR